MCVIVIDAYYLLLQVFNLLLETLLKQLLRTSNLQIQDTTAERMLMWILIPRWDMSKLQSDIEE